MDHGYIGRMEIKGPFFCMEEVSFGDMELLSELQGFLLLTPFWWGDLSQQEMESDMWAELTNSLIASAIKSSNSRLEVLPSDDRLSDQLAAPKAPGERF